MIRLVQDLLTILSAIRLLPHWLVFNLHPEKENMHYDCWWILDHTFYWHGQQLGFLYLMTFSKEYRNVFYCRMGKSRYLLHLLCPPLSTLFVGSETTIGRGLYIQHGLSTIVNAHKIGESVWINQLVTVGSDGIGTPTLGNNVRIAPGAQVLGKITIGNNVFIGPNSVVLKDIPDNCSVSGIPARIFKRDGLRVDEKL